VSTAQDVLVTVEHMREANLCVRGMKQWCRLHQIDFAEVVRRGGIPASELEKTGDVLALRLVQIARDDQEGRI
jgi:hypothetical protein